MKCQSRRLLHGNTGRQGDRSREAKAAQPAVQATHCNSQTSADVHQTRDEGQSCMKQSFVSRSLADPCITSRREGESTREIRLGPCYRRLAHSSRSSIAASPSPLIVMFTAVVSAAFLLLFLQITPRLPSLVMTVIPLSLLLPPCSLAPDHLP